MTTWSAHVDVEIVAAATAPSAAAAAPAPSAAAAKKARPAPMNMLSPARVVRQSSAKPPKVGFTTSFLKDKPWLAVQHVAERKMWSLRRKRLEFTVRMGVIYALTTLYAVANAIRNSSAFGTYPVLANFYATFTLMPTIGCSVLSALEMCRGCVYGYALALAVVEITLAVDASTGNEVGSVWLLALLLLLTTVFTVVAPLFTLEEKKMLLFSVVNAGYNGHDRVRKRHDPSYTLNARYDTWYHPLLELLSCVMGFLIALAICFFPYGMWAISELRGRIEFQASQISALLRTQHFVARTNSAIGISESKQIADALRNNQQQMRGLMSDALYEIAHRGANLKCLHDTFHHFEGQLPLLLAKGLFVEGRLDDGNVTEQAEQIEFLAIVDASWLALEDAIDEANSEVVAAERDRHAILPTVWSNLEDRLLKFRQATDLARQRAIYGRTSEVTNELIERHKRRMCHLAVVEQHALRVLASKDAVYRDAATWTLSRAVRLVFELLFVVSTSRRTWKQASSGHGGLSKASLVESAKMVVSMAVCMCMHFVPQLRTSEFVSGQGYMMLVTVIFVLKSDYGSSTFTSMHRIYGSLLGSMFALMLLSLKVDICANPLMPSIQAMNASTIDAAALETCEGAVSVIGLTLWGAVCGLFMSVGDYQSYIACFTAPIIVIGFEPEQRNSSVANRMLATIIGVTIFFVCENACHVDADGKFAWFGLQTRHSQWNAQKDILLAMSEALGAVTSDPAAPALAASRNAQTAASKAETIDGYFEPPPPPPEATGTLAGIATVSAQMASLAIASKEPFLFTTPFPMMKYFDILTIERRILDLSVVLRTGWVLATSPAQGGAPNGLLEDFKGSLKDVLKSASEGAQTVAKNWSTFHARVANPNKHTADLDEYGDAAQVVLPLSPHVRKALLDGTQRALNAELAHLFSSGGQLPHEVAQGASLLSYVLSEVLNLIAKLGEHLRELHYRTSPVMQRTAVITHLA